MNKLVKLVSVVENYIFVFSVIFAPSCPTSCSAPARMQSGWRTCLSVRAGWRACGKWRSNLPKSLIAINDYDVVDTFLPDALFGGQVSIVCHQEIQNQISLNPSFSKRDLNSLTFGEVSKLWKNHPCLFPPLAKGVRGIWNSPITYITAPTRPCRSPAHRCAELNSTITHPP